MKKSAALVLSALALGALPTGTHAQTAKPAVASPPAAVGPGFKIDDLGCTVRMSFYRNLSLNIAGDKAKPAEQQAQARNSAILADIALNYYLGRLSLAAADPYRAQRGEAIFKTMKAATPQQNSAETQACGQNAQAQTKVLMDTLKVK